MDTEPQCEQSIPKENLRPKQMPINQSINQFPIKKSSLMEGPRLSLLWTNCMLKDCGSDSQSRAWLPELCLMGRLERIFILGHGFSVI